MSISTEQWNEIYQAGYKVGFEHGKTEGRYEKFSEQFDADDHNQMVQNVLADIIDPRPFTATYEAGNMKRQMWSKTEKFKSLDAAKKFIVEGIGSMQGSGSVMKGGEVVFEYFPDEEEMNFRAQMLELEFA
jgi:hypothetical protein